MKTVFLNLIVVFLTAAACFSCKKDATENGTKAVFSYVADGFKANFTNFSTGAISYYWDFGDGDTSIAKSPVHIFKSKGDFLVSLKAMNGGQVSEFIDTVSVLGPNIKIDGDFTDWEYVSYSSVNESGSSSVTGVKTFAATGYLYFYLEGTADMKLEVVDIYIDADNNTATGFNTWMYPAGSGADFLFEGSTTWGDLYKHTGDPASFSFTPVQSFAEAIRMSPVSNVDGKNVVEFSISTAKMGAVKTAVNYAIVESTAGWAEIGNAPLSKQPGSKFGRIDL